MGGNTIMAAGPGAVSDGTRLRFFSGRPWKGSFRTVLGTRGAVTRRREFAGRIVRRGAGAAKPPTPGVADSLTIGGAPAG